MAAGSRGISRRWDQQSEPSPTAEGFVIFVSDGKGQLAGFIADFATAFVELHPTAHTAWRFETIEAAKTAGRCAFGPLLEDLVVAVFPVSAALLHSQLSDSSYPMLVST